MCSTFSSIVIATIFFKTKLQNYLKLHQSFQQKYPSNLLQYKKIFIFRLSTFYIIKGQCKPSWYMLTSFYSKWFSFIFSYLSQFWLIFCFCKHCLKVINNNKEWLFRFIQKSMLYYISRHFFHFWSFLFKNTLNVLGIPNSTWWWFFYLPFNVV